MPRTIETDSELVRRIAAVRSLRDEAGEALRRNTEHQFLLRLSLQRHEREARGLEAELDRLEAVLAEAAEVQARVAIERQEKAARGRASMAEITPVRIELVEEEPA